MRLTIAVIAGAAVLTALLLACQPGPKYIEGGLYSVPVENGRYSVIKILKIDDGGVHLRMYSNTFPQRPREIDSARLYMAGIDHKPNEQLGMGHAPIAHASFRTWGAEFIRKEPVQQEELDGYKMWKEAKGGYF